MTLAAARRELRAPPAAGPELRFAAADPASRLFWLDRPEVVHAIGANRVAQMRRQIERELKRLDRVACSYTWHAAAFNGAQFPVPGMVLSRAKSQFSSTGDSALAPPSRRYTPPIAVNDEDLMDAMSVTQALGYRHPPSCSAMAIRQIQMSKGREFTPKKRRARKSDRALTGGFFENSDGRPVITYA
jgi:hypothetical protein